MDRVIEGYQPKLEPDQGNMKMDKDLKWLAENVHKWPKHVFDADMDKGGVHITSQVYTCDGIQLQINGFTREEWQAARDELSGKPKEWDGEWLAQNSEGMWSSFDGSEKPVVCKDQYYGTSKGSLHRYGKGKVLGDWRDTLEHRPKQATKQAPKQWLGPENGLPPVGEMVQSARYANPCSVKYASDHVIVIESDFGDECVVSLGSLSRVNTEEDKAVSEMVALRSIPKANIDAYTDFARDLYQAGYRNNQKLISELYQVLGELKAPDQVLDQVEAVLLNQKPPHDTLLPFIGLDK